MSGSFLVSIEYFREDGSSVRRSIVVDEEVVKQSKSDPLHFAFIKARADLAEARREA